MKEYSLENLKEKIDNKNTQDYFNEVIQTYYIGCYRSSVVMLYSVVVCDLVYKLEDLRDIYNDPKAKKILLEIEKLQTSNPSSPEWEVKLVDMIQDRMDFLELSDITNIRQLQKHRHLSAHPVLNQTSLLYIPNKDTVKAHMRNMLEGILSRPAVLTTNIFEKLIEDLANINDTIDIEKDLERYLEARFIKNLRQETINIIFKKLWKFVFFLTDENCEEYRYINYQTLLILLKKNESEIYKYIELNNRYFEVCITDDHTKFKINALLFNHPKIYSFLREDIKLKISSAFPKEDGVLQNWFLYDSFDEYFSEITAMKSSGTRLILGLPDLVFELYSLYKEHDKGNDFLDLVIHIYSRSENYDNADNNYFDVILPLLGEFTQKHFIKIFKATDSNHQIYGRKRAVTHNRKIVEEWDNRLGSRDEIRKYNNFRF
jgi:hypothetical protein